MPETITITKAELASAIALWEQQARDGGWEPRLDLTPQQIGKEDADLIWPMLLKEQGLAA